MIAIIRIKGKIKVEKDIEETFERLRLRKKYSCRVLEKNQEIEGMLKKIENFVAYGTIDEKTLKELKEKRKTNYENFFRLHPPRGGINSKERFPKGVLGNHKEKINELIMRML